MTYQPKIIAYLCTWCSYTGADTAGIARLKSPANLRAIRVPCSGRVSPEIVMRTFDQGADGVLILGCHIGECHYDSGNHRTAKRVPVLQSLMAFSGLEPERLRLDWVSASEGERFSRIVTEFTETVRSLGPVNWRVRNRGTSFERQSTTEWEKTSHDQERAHPFPDLHDLQQTNLEMTAAIQSIARDLLTSGKVACVIGYENGTHGRTRPAFIYHPQDAGRLVWNQDCTHNLAAYLPKAVHPASHGRQPVAPRPVAIVAKSCDSRAINVQLVENKYTRDQVYVIGVNCPGIQERSACSHQPQYQNRCQECETRTPSLYDTLVGDPIKAVAAAGQRQSVDALQNAAPQERMEYWLSQFDRCIRCYACRQACPMCDCPTCLYERDDSLWVGMGIGVNEKRAFHLGRAYHLAGRCVDCRECERVCPMEIPISLLNLRMAQEMETLFGYRPGWALTPSPFVTLLSGEEHLP